MKPDPTNSTAAATQYRVVVRSAAEAVAVVRERFGESARVVSVRQIEAGGLARFIQRPRLEVIVEVGAAGGRLIERSEEAALPASEPATGMTTVADEVATEAPLPIVVPRQVSILRATGLDDLLLERIRADHPGVDWDRVDAPEALARLGAWLRRQYQQIPPRACEARRVFLGPCGAGKTSALCKMLALDVFVHGRQAAVLKLDGEIPNATDGLAAFCDVLGVPLLRSVAEIAEFDAASLVYVDVPGVGLDARGEQGRLVQTLDALDVRTRILVVHAGWEAELIAEAYEMGRVCGATHVFFTHMDEVRRPAKLWRFVLSGGLRPVACGAGPSPAGEIEEDVFSGLMARTVPAAIAQSAGRERRPV